MKQMKFIINTGLLILLMAVAACKKDWLEAKSSLSIVTPSTLNDFQKLLDNSSVFNTIHPYLAELSSDNYYTLSANLNAASIIRQNSYIWAVDQYPGQNEAVSGINDWSYPHQRIFYANNVLDGLSGMSTTGAEYNNIRGSALFFRAFNYYILAQEFAPPYSDATADTDLGLPLRSKADISATYVRATVRQTYDFIVKDIKEAITLLPVVPLYKTRPSLPAAYALMSRIYLNTKDYEKAGKYADSCLSLYGKLMDYNSLNASASFPIKLFNDEVIFQTISSTATPFSASGVIVDTFLYASYHTDDLRKTVFFTPSASVSGKFGYKGSYYGSALPFKGIATDEVYLTRAECYARQGLVAEALRDMDTLLIRRWKNSVPYPPFTAVNAADALQKILTERRKELIFRDLRWTDLRRLNQEGANITLTRIINNQTYTLSPNDKRYTFHIPDAEIISSGIQQNQRQ